MARDSSEDTSKEEFGSQNNITLIADQITTNESGFDSVSDLDGLSISETKKIFLDKMEILQ